MKQYFVEYNGRGASLLLGAEPERSNRPNGGGTAGGGGSTRTDGTFPFGVSLTGGGGGGLAGSGGTAGPTGTTGSWSNAGGAGYVSGGGARRRGTAGYTVLVTSVGTGGRAKALVAPQAAREALGTPPSLSLDGLDTSCDGGSQHGPPEPHGAHKGGT
jgi:hypothetical protein